MSTGTNFPRPNGEIQGENIRDLADKGTQTGTLANYGADLSQDSTNGFGAIGGDSQSDPFGQRFGKAPNISGSDRGLDGTGGMGSITGDTASDPMDEDEASDSKV